MLNFIYAILFSISANIDSIPIGISYGIKKIYISPKKNLLIAFCTTIITYIAMQLGDLLIYFISENIANSIGALALIGIGIYTVTTDVIKSIFERKKKVKDVEVNSLRNINHLKISELLVLVLTLSWNNIATGFAASFAGINIVMTIIFNFIFSFLFLSIGNKIGNNVINKYIEKYSNLISSVILILLGVLELII